MYRNKILKLSLVVCFLLSSQLLQAGSPGGSSSSVFVGLVVLIIIFLFAVIITIANKLLKLTADRVGATKTGENFSVIPTLKDLFGSDGASTSGKIVLDKGFDIPLAGAADTTTLSNAKSATYAIKPIDIQGMSPIPKVVVLAGESVKAGDVVFFDKKNPAVKYVAPVSGELVELNRGAKRRIDELVILADKKIEYKSFDAPSLGASREELINFLAESGGLAFIRQRPYNVAVNVEETPRDIFISTFDTAPLAPDLSFAIQGKEAAFQKGLDVLNKLTTGSVYLGIDGRAGATVSPAFANAKGVKSTAFAGKHPAGVVGIQIHHTAPINKDEIVWTLDVQAVATIGTLFLEGRYDASRVVALTGAELATPKYVNTYQGASIGELTQGEVENANSRYVSGNVLTGTQVSQKGFLGFFDSQVTVLAEGDQHEMFGWLVPIKARSSISPTIPTGLYPEKWVAHTNTHGEKRAFVMTGQYESVTPMDIYPQHLLKSILVNDFERMEGLGLYELVEEDLALCEFVCTSKQDIQAILRQGLDMMREQG